MSLELLAISRFANEASTGEPCSEVSDCSDMSGSNEVVLSTIVSLGMSSDADRSFLLAAGHCSTESCDKLGVSALKKCSKQ